MTDSVLLPESYPRLQLNKGADRRLQRGHRWIYSNEIDNQQTPLKEITPGALVSIVNASGRWLASGYANPHSLIAVRVCSLKQEEAIDATWIERQLQRALQLRQRLFDHTCYRLVHAEGDGLPGLIVDRFDDTLVVQINTAGIEQLQSVIVDKLVALLQPQCIHLRNLGKARELEQLELFQKTVYGEMPDRVTVKEGDAVLQVPVETGQKTGWFFDHSPNRLQLRHLVASFKSASVLDVYCYTGAWAVQAGLGGAASLTLIDSSADAMALAAANLDANAALMPQTVQRQQLQGDATTHLRALQQQEQRFDVVVLDPPAFIKRKKDLANGQRHYLLNARLALSLLKPDGLLYFASCSQALSQEDLVGCLQEAARREKRQVQLLGYLSQGPDHPVPVAMPETRYLKGVLAVVVD